MLAKPELIFRDEKILIVDDISKWINVVKNNLIYYGCFEKNIITSESIDGAFIKYEKYSPELIVTDINFDIRNLEDVQGLSFIGRLRDSGYDGFIVAMSSSTENIERGIRQQMGINYFIDKSRFLDGFDNFAKWYMREI